ncbi:phosphate ABC transporter permease PstA [Halocatena pleomorpha]|uniref:Phosphate transport system permease protein PstA n=1 Tax=Halocatena pleomorpha TaxID=1785090 RepID=A0A3P3RN30_9EURY|nr:phosphate ABC transporter permease PstA [Halocatena pleomorpha]RRJ33803.1 phosphate ABC transporter permease PstA [Halocatena pleomorpha]
MSTERQTQLVSTQSSIGSRATVAIIGLGLVVFAVSWLALFQWIGGETDVLGVGLFRLLGVCLLFIGVGTGACGFAARSGRIAATPRRSAGLLTGVLFGLLGFLVGGLSGAQTFGLGTAGWLVSAAGIGTAAATAAVFPREELGSTIPPSVFVTFVGAVITAGIIDAGWTWTPVDLSVTLIGPVVVPLLTIVASLIGVWSAAKAHSGFGARGRQSGAFLLISLSILGMLSVLVLLVGFIVVRGLDTVLTDAGVGIGSITVLNIQIPWVDVQIPFLMNVTQGLFVDVNGILPAIVGTLWLVIGAVVFAVPLGIGAAIFLTEYSESERFTQLVEIATNGLWSTPSIVFGLFGLTFLLPRISNNHRSLLGGQLVLGFMLLPLVVITSYEAIKAVPDEFRDASAALGVTRWQTIRSVVLPAAMPGIITGIILGVGRIAGETAPLLFVFPRSTFPSSVPNVLGSFEFSLAPPFVTNEALLSGGSALPYQLYASITSGHVPGQTFTVEQFGWGTAFVLLIVVLALYGIGITTRLYFQRKLQHE